MQNLSARREADYARIAADRYRWPIRSFVTGMPWLDGWKTLLVEADLSGAELLMLAVQARDKAMIDHALRSALDESDPNYYDIHSTVCVTAFKLDCPPTKSGLKSIGKKHLRVGAKATIFARNYGGGAATIARRIQEDGVFVTVPEVQAMLDAIDTLYPATRQYREACGERVSDPGWLATCFGRYRRFRSTDEQSVLSDMQREAGNVVIQGGVADAVNIALDRLLHHPRREAIGYKMALQVHDAIMLEVPVAHVGEVYDDILPGCMETVMFRSCSLDGVPFADSPEYHFGTERKVFARWGEQLTWAECDQLGIERRFGYNPEAIQT